MVLARIPVPVLGPVARLARVGHVVRIACIVRVVLRRLRSDIGGPGHCRRRQPRRRPARRGKCGGSDGAGRSGGGGSGDLTFAGSGRAALAVAWDPGAALGLAGEAELSWSLPNAGGGAASATAAEDAAQTDAARAQAARDGAAVDGALGPNHGSPQVRAASRTDDPYEPTPPPDTVLQRLREGVASTAGRTVGGAQALGGFAADMVGGGAAVVEKGYEAAVAGVEAATDWISDDHAQRQRAGLDARTDAFIEAAEEVLSDPIGVATAIAGGFEARYAQADALEAAYRSGHGDLSVYREAERIRAVADMELTILGVETAAVAAGGTGRRGEGAARCAHRRPRGRRRAHRRRHGCRAEGAGGCRSGRHAHRAAGAAGTVQRGGRRTLGRRERIDEPGGSRLRRRRRGFAVPCGDAAGSGAFDRADVALGRDATRPFRRP